MTQFVVASHSTFAKGLTDVVHFFDTNVSNLHFIEAYVNGDADFENEFLKLLDQMQQEDIIVFTDISGGSVNRIVCQHITDRRLRVISGVNLSVVLELVLKPGYVSDSDIEHAVSAAREQLIYMNTALKSNVDEEDDLND